MSCRRRVYLHVSQMNWEICAYGHLRLIVAFAVCNGLFAVTSVCQGVADICKIPLFILELFENLDPHIRNGHGQSVIKADTTQGERNTQSWHSGYIFSNGYAIRVQRVQHLVGDHEVHNGLFVNTVTKILMVTTRETP